MSDPHEIRGYEYVTVPYEKVRDALRSDTLGVFQRATATAASRAKALESVLTVKLGGFELGTDTTISVGGIVDEPLSTTLGVPRTEITLEWRATRASAVFPVMKAVLTLFPLSKHETQLAFVGTYDPPMGLVGDAFDAVVGRRIAEATVHRFVEDVAEQLNRELARNSSAGK